MHFDAGRFLSRLQALSDPGHILELLHYSVAQPAGLRVLGGWRWPVVPSDPTRWQIGRNLWPGPETPKQFFPQYLEALKKFGPTAMQKMARLGDDFTFTEARRQSNNSDGWVFSFLQTWGIRDGLYCPSGPWMVVFVSSKVLRLGRDQVANCTWAAHQGAKRMKQTAPRETRGDRADLAKSELDVLRHLADDRPMSEIAGLMKIKENTARKYLARAKGKLRKGHNTGVVAAALRARLIV